MQLFNLKGKTALITGASRGFGERFTRTLSEKGARSILAARNLSKLQALADELPDAYALQMDTSDKTSVQKAFAILEQNNERIDICVNNAGAFKATPIFKTDEEDNFDAIIQTNVMSMWYVTKAIATHMMNHNIPGSIINIGSIYCPNYLQANRAGYCISKAVMVQMTKALADELAKDGIRINCIIPRDLHASVDAYNAIISENHQDLDGFPLSYMITPPDLEGTIFYLASNEASRYVNGASITIDIGIFKRS